MKEIISENIIMPYSLHDMRIVKLMQNEDKLCFEFDLGVFDIAQNCIIKNAYISFEKVDWDFSYIYILDFAENEGSFTGEKHFLSDYISSVGEIDFEVSDETFGYNMTKYFGYLRNNNIINECFIEIYHLGARIYHKE